MDSFKLYCIVFFGIFFKGCTRNGNSSSSVLNSTESSKCVEYYFVVITVRNEVAKVMFLHLSVSHSVHRGVCLNACWDTTHPLPPLPPTPVLPGTRHPPGPGPSPWDQAPPADSYCCGWYASYWNAFLFKIKSTKIVFYRFCRIRSTKIVFYRFCRI